MRGRTLDIHSNCTLLVMERVTGNPEKEALATGKSEEEVYLEQQLASASAEMEHIKAQKAAEKEQRMRTKQSSSSETSTVCGLEHSYNSRSIDEHGVDS